MKAQQSILILCDDAANVRKIAAGIRGIPGVTEARPGTFQRERVTKHKVSMFFPSVERGQAPAGIEVDESN